jgi:ribosomal protein L7/L12
VGSDENILDHGRRIAELERKVAELYKRIGDGEPTGFGGAFDDGFEPASVNATDDPRLAGLIQSGDKIRAIKLYRELTGVGLAEAKDAVERLESMYAGGHGG